MEGQNAIMRVWSSLASCGRPLDMPIYDHNSRSFKAMTIGDWAEEKT
jgi:hypothetical protein